MAGGEMSGLLIIQGIVFWIVGLLGFLNSQRVNHTGDAKPSLITQLGRSIRFRVERGNKSERIASLFQVIGEFWLATGLILVLGGELISLRVIAPLIFLAYVVPIGILIGMIAS
jgi:hypothetical protein